MNILPKLLWTIHGGLGKTYVGKVWQEVGRSGEKRIDRKGILFKELPVGC